MREGSGRVEACWARAKRECKDSSVGDMGAPCSEPPSWPPAERDPDRDDSEPDSMEGDRERGTAKPAAEGEDVRAGEAREVERREDIQPRERVLVLVGERCMFGRGGERDCERSWPRWRELSEDVRGR